MDGAIIAILVVLFVLIVTIIAVVVIKWKKRKSPVKTGGTVFVQHKGCPDGWTKLSGGKCKAPSTYNGPCDKISDFSNTTDSQKRSWAKTCGVKWSSLPDPVHVSSGSESSESESSESSDDNIDVDCPDGWKGTSDGKCRAPSSYTGPCGGISEFSNYTNDQKWTWAKDCGAKWSGLLAPSGDGGVNSQTKCTTGWVKIGDVCKPPRGSFEIDIMKLTPMTTCCNPQCETEDVCKTMGVPVGFWGDRNRFTKIVVSYYPPTNSDGSVRKAIATRAVDVDGGGTITQPVYFIRMTQWLGESSKLVPTVNCISNGVRNKFIGVVNRLHRSAHKNTLLSRLRDANYPCTDTGIDIGVATKIWGSNGNRNTGVVVSFEPSRDQRSFATMLNYPAEVYYRNLASEY